MNDPCSLHSVRRRVSRDPHPALHTVAIRNYKDSESTSRKAHRRPANSRVSLSGQPNGSLRVTSAFTPQTGLSPHVARREKRPNNESTFANYVVRDAFFWEAPC
jgi:hypothetical protein